MGLTSVSPFVIIPVLNLIEMIKMKRLILALAVLASSAHATPVEDYINQNTQDTFKQIEQLRHPERAKDNYPVYQCQFTVTDEKNPRKKWKSSLNTAGVQFHEDINTYIYYDQDETGSTVVYVDKKTHRATINTQDASGDIISSGDSPACNKIN